MATNNLSMWSSKNLQLSHFIRWLANLMGTPCVTVSHSILAYQINLLRQHRLYYFLIKVNQNLVACIRCDFSCYEKENWIFLIGDIRFGHSLVIEFYFVITVHVDGVAVSMLKCSMQVLNFRFQYKKWKMIVKHFIFLSLFSWIDVRHKRMHFQV